jgi:short-subunit dehydrogenase
VPTEFQATNDAQELVNKLPGFVQVSAERVVVDALKAADHGQGSVVPGGPQVKLALGSSRFVPTPLALPVLKRMLKR